MWRVLTQLPSLLTELIAVIREQNQLHREQMADHGLVSIVPQTRRPSLTPRRKLTEADVHRYTPADYAAARRKSQEALIAPHRVTSTTALEETSALLNSTSVQPNPLVPEILDPSGRSGPLGPA